MAANFGRIPGVIAVSKKSGGSKSFKLGRDSRTGEFMPVERARHRSDAQVEHVPKRGYGDTDRGGKKK